jgi:hypothetical protein
MTSEDRHEKSCFIGNSLGIEVLEKLLGSTLLLQ